mmetsp:Transcript_69963/g.193500  ORF Transcript_69963/g.193500 Transcript_69963/m.193500 type:complete len:230 (-) Transcript_69963:754-1443(-)
MGRDCSSQGLDFCSAEWAFSFATCTQGGTSNPLAAHSQGKGACTTERVGAARVNKCWQKLQQQRHALGPACARRRCAPRHTVDRADKADQCCEGAAQVLALDGGLQALEHGKPLLQRLLPQVWAQPGDHLRRLQAHAGQRLITASNWGLPQQRQAPGEEGAWRRQQPPPGRGGVRLRQRLQRALPKKELVELPGAAYAEAVRHHLHKLQGVAHRDAVAPRAKRHGKLRW